MLSKPVSYVNTLVPGFDTWIPGEPTLTEQPRGIGYSTGTHMVHLYQRSAGWWVVSPGLTATEESTEAHGDWVVRHFGAEGLVEQTHEAGQVTEWVWRPGLVMLDQIQQALDTTEAEQRRAEQSLHLLLERLSELLLFIEPDATGLGTYSLKTRELLILAATDVEDMWARFLRRANVPEKRNGYSTNDFVRLLAPLHLADYQLSMAPYQSVAPMRPFVDWDPNRPTQSLSWYHAYNQCKHDKTGKLQEATLLRCLHAVAASFVMYAARFSPYPLFLGSTPVASLTQHLLKLEIVDPDMSSFYVPALTLPPDLRNTLQCFDSNRMHAPWTAIPLSTVI